MQLITRLIYSTLSRRHMMNKPLFPKWHFAIISTSILITALVLGLWLSQQPFKEQSQINFDNLAKQIQNEISTIETIHKGIRGNLLSTSNFALESSVNLNVYVDDASKNKPYVSFYLLPKVYGRDIAAFEARKRYEGFITFQVFGSADIDQNAFDEDKVHFPVATVKDKRITSLRHLGRDVYSYLPFYDAINRAISNNQTAAGWSYSFSNNPNGISIFAPIYETNFIDKIKPNERINRTQLLISAEIFLEELVEAFSAQIFDINEHYQITLKTQKSKQEYRSTDVINFSSKLVPFSKLMRSEHEQKIQIADKFFILKLSTEPTWNQLQLSSVLSVLLFALFWVTVIFLSLKKIKKQQAQQEQFEKLIEEERNQANATLSSLGEGVISSDKDGFIHYINPKAKEIFAISHVEEKPQLNIEALLPDLPKVTSTLFAAIEENKNIYLSDIRTANARKEEILLDITVAPLHKTDGSIHGATLVIEEVSHLEAMRQKIERMATYDHLTSLINRYELERQLKETILLAHQTGDDHAFAYLDLDQFKVVNDTAGHMAGDQLLRQLSNHVVKLSLPDNAVLGRLGGDEFGLILHHTSLEEATHICNQLIDNIRQYVFVWQDKRFQVGVSIGLVMIDQQQLSVEQCLIAADSACYIAKEKGRNRVEHATTDNIDMAQRQEELSWVERIPRAIKENRLILYIQHMKALANDAPHSEVLVRMLDESGQIMPPGSFINAAERYGIMDQIDEWVVRKSIENIQRVHELNTLDKHVYSINLSGHSLTNEHFMTFILHTLHNNANLAPFICFEITETAVMSNFAQAIDYMKQIRATGAALALDDFGSGLSSFNYLRHMPISYLKIDGAFVRNMHEDKINHAIVANIHQLSDVFKIKTVAEFVENEAILQELDTIGVHYAQGYGVHKPEPWLV